jgi:hypothetical protein
MINTNQTGGQKRSVKSLIADREVKLSNNLTSKQFIERYKTCDELMEYTYQLQESPNGTEYTETFFDHVQLGLKIVSPILTKYDKGGNKYTWLVFSNSVGTKVTLDDAIIAFIKDYQHGSIKPDFDFYDLVEEAKRQQTLGQG